MAYNVFGNLITNSTLEGLPEYEAKTITHLNRAHVALYMKNAQQKDFNARNYVENLKKEWGTGVSTLCLIYNATGNTLKLVNYYDWHGHLGLAPYPMEIENGQWGGFLHVKTNTATTGSSGAVVYRGLNNANEVCDWMACWSNAWNQVSFDNKAYTEIREEDHFKNNGIWDYIESLLGNSKLISRDDQCGCKSNVSIGNDTTAVFEAIFTLKDADNK